MIRYLETAARRWWLWLLPLVVPPLVFGLLLTRAPQYDTNVTIWAERATYLNVPSENPWITPAQAQSGLLTELLRTRSFIDRVAGQTDLRVYTTTEAGQTFLEEYFARRLWVGVRGAQLIEITFRTSQPELGLAVLNAVIKTYTEHVTQTGREQAQIASEFYARQLPEREKEFVAATRALRDYIASLGGLTPNEQLPANDRLMQSSQLAELQRREDLARKRYEDTFANLERIQLQASARETAQERGFRVMDLPNVPSRPASARRELVTYIGIAVGASLGLAVAGTLLFTWLDPTLRGPGEVQRRLGLPALGSVPRLRAGRRARPHPAIRSLALAAARPGLPPPGRLAGTSADD